MSVLKGLEPERVFYYFEELSKIPHGSGDTKRISDFCADFAKEKGLEFIQDEKNNIIIKKDKQNSQSNNTVIIQGHLDMVCEKEEDFSFDFKCDPLILKIEDGFIKAEGTTLGGDDAVAIAYALALLEDKNISHPPIEAVFTVDEEIGLLGAQFIDLSSLKGKLLLNIDCEEEGIFTVSCAGGGKIDFSLPVEYMNTSGIKYNIKIHGLLGGHSGVEIDKLRANSNVISARLLSKIIKFNKTNLVNIKGGLKDNAIPNLTYLEVICEKEIDDIINAFYEDVKKEYRVSDNNIKIDFTKEKSDCLALTTESTKKASCFLLAFPNGVINMDLEIEGLVKTSLNMGVLSMDKNSLNLTVSVRSSLKSEKEALIDKLLSIASLSGATAKVGGEYPPWEYKSESLLREVTSKVYLELFNKEATFEAIHAGLECGVLSEKIENLDAIAFGPDIFDIHTPKERIDIKSVERVWKFIKRILEEL